MISCNSASRIRVSRQCCVPAVAPGSIGRARATSCAAVKRVIEPVYFQDVFIGAADRIFGSAGYLKREETLVMCESVRVVEDCFKTLELCAKHLENRMGQDVDDWHHRKKYYMRICEQALKMDRGSDVIFGLFGNMQRFQVSTYFGKEVIVRLGSQGAHPALLLRIAELVKLQRGTSDKGVRSAYAELLATLVKRNTEADQEIIPKVKAEIAALKAAPAAAGSAAAPAAAVPAMAEARNVEANAV